MRTKTKNNQTNKNPELIINSYTFQDIYMHFGENYFPFNFSNKLLLVVFGNDILVTIGFKYIRQSNRYLNLSWFYLSSYEMMPNESQHFVGHSITSYRVTFSL